MFLKLYNFSSRKIIYSVVLRRINYIGEGCLCVLGGVCISEKSGRLYADDNAPLNEDGSCDAFPVPVLVNQDQVFYPYNLDYICAAFPPRRGYLGVRKDRTNYELFNIAPGKKWEMVYPLRDEDPWIIACKKQYIGPDLVMIDDYTYTTYIKLF